MGGTTVGSMARDNLTPSVVTDKNGRVTTVHKRGFKTRSNSSGFPSPSALIVEADKALAQRVADALEVHHGRQDDLQVRTMIRKLGENAEAFVELVEKAVQDSLDGRGYGRSNLSYLSMSLVDMEVSDIQVLAKYRDALPEDVYFNDARFVLKVLAQRYEGDTESTDYFEQVRAHLYAASVYQRPTDKNYALFEYEENRALFDMVMRRPAEVEEIMRVHNTYKVINMTDEVMEECLRTHPAVGQGVL